MEEAKGYFERALAEVDALPPVSNVFHKILELTDEAGASREELIHCVSLDQAIAAKVLQMINSAYYGMECKISSLEVAVGLLGDKRVREIAIMCSASSVLRGGIRSYGILADQFWLHSIATGITARLIADRCAPEHRETAFVGGLLHDIGKVVINRLIEEPHKEMFQKTAESMTPDYHATENSLYGFDHCTIGFFLARNWNFSEDLSSAIAFHHYPDQEAEQSDLIRIVCSADLVAHLVFSESDEGRIAEILENEVQLPVELSRRALEEVVVGLKQEIGDSQAFLGI